MQITRNSLETAAGPADWFTGDVYIDTIATAAEPSRLAAASVHFTPGARTAWHTHPFGQTIYVTEGLGRCQRRGGGIEVIRPGDRVYFEPGEDHWHGAAPDRFMSHIAMQEVDDAGSPVTWGEHVTDEEYDAPAGYGRWPTEPDAARPPDMKFAVAATQQQKGEAFRALHGGDAFVIPNPWDAGSAKVLEGQGFKALATTSGGFALTLGKRDGEQTIEETVRHVGALCEATEVPISVDLENGYGPAPQDAARAITRVAEAGAVGGSIEDWDRDEGRVYEPQEAAERISAAVDAARSLGFPFTLTARAENFLRGNPDLDDTIARLRAYEEAGADVVYAPRLTTAEQVRAVCDAVSKPVNVLAFAALGLSFAELSAAGAQRVSVGGWLTYTAMNAAVEVAERIRDSGDFSGLAGPAEIKRWQLG